MQPRPQACAPTTLGCIRRRRLVQNFGIDVVAALIKGYEMSVNPPIPRDCLTPAQQQADVVLSEYLMVRSTTLRLVEPLSAEDCALQAMPDASPAKWHLAHTSWFFEALVLAPNIDGYQPINETYLFLFNSYYNTLGKQFHRPHRGLLTRPSLDETLDYRRAVDDRVRALLESADARLLERIVPTLVVGLNHEQQHQELILTDIKALFSMNPLKPVYRSAPEDRANVTAASSQAARWVEIAEGLCEIGHGGPGFSYDNETPRHRVWLDACAVAERAVTNAEFAAFIADGGYERPELWLSDGWKVVQQQDWQAPLYWAPTDEGWSVFTLGGVRPLDPTESVCHVSYFEADAFARWAGARLLTEAEWEVAATLAESENADVGALIEDERYHPAAASAPSSEGPRLTRMIGDVWEWTSSSYTAYPGYRPPAGALGEYNAKFMCNQWTLRGGSCATPRSHIRTTYRNFFPADARWQFSGIRLARM